MLLVTVQVAPVPVKLATLARTYAQGASAAKPSAAAVVAVPERVIVPSVSQFVLSFETAIVTVAVYAPLDPFATAINVARPDGLATAVPVCDAPPATRNDPNVVTALEPPALPVRTYPAPLVLS